MKLVGLILLLFISLSAFSHPRDSVRAIERQNARIERKNVRIADREIARQQKEKVRLERKRAHVMEQWDQRSVLQKRNDGRALIFLALCAGALIHVMSTHQE